MTRLRAGSTAVLTACSLAACGAAQASTATLPSRLVPAAYNGFTVEEETAVRPQFTVPDGVVSEGRFFTLRRSGDVEATLEVALLKADVDGTDPDNQQSIRKQVGGGDFTYYLIGDQWVGVQSTADDTIAVWFPRAREDVFDVLTVARDITRPIDVVAGLIRYQEEKG